MTDNDPGFEQPAGEESLVGEPAPAPASLSEDIAALLEDGRTYVEAEIQFQKSRAGFVADRAKAGAVYGLAALAVLHLALVALVVGCVLALAPLIGPLGATGAVVGVLALAAIILALAARKRVARLFAAFGDGRP